MGQRKFLEAARLLDDEERSRTPLAGELALLQIQLPIAQWQAGNPAAGAGLPAPLAKNLEERADRIRRDVGGYWSYRADLVIRQVREIATYGAELAGLA